MKTKYFYIIATAAMMLAACSTDDELAADVSSVADEQSAVQTEGFYGMMGDQLQMLPEEDMDGGPSSGTRSTIGSDGYFASWSTTDKISISDGKLNYVYQVKENTNSANCSFTAREGHSAFALDEAATFRAFYPADAVLGWNNNTLSTMVYTEQDYTENCENSGVMGPYMVAEATTTQGGSSATFTFGHLCSVIDVDLSTFDGGKVDAVSLYANSQISIAGSVKYDFSTKAMTVSGNDGTSYSYSKQSEMIRVSNVNATNPVVRFYVLPMKQTAGFTITVRTSNGMYYTKKSSTAVGNDDLNEYVTSQGGVSGGTLCKPFYKKYKFGTISSARTQNWMAMIPGNVKFNHLSLPGAHDAATSGCSSSAAKCQAYTIAEQLSKGCRALDLRPYYNSSNLEIYHGVASTGVTLANALDAVKNFLTDNPTETVFVLIAQEGGSDGNTNWQNRVWSCVNGYTNYIASYGWEGNLNPCRGKMVVIFRNTYTGGTNNGDLGCGKVGWGSSFNDKTILTGNGSGTERGTLRYQDEYETNKATKLTNLETMLTSHIGANETNASYTFVNNTNSTYGQTLPNVSSIATEVNTAVLTDATFTGHTGKFCIMFTDFLFSSTNKGDQMFELIHGQNYKYVYKDRTRCTTASGEDTGTTIRADEYADGSQVFSRRR